MIVSSALPLKRYEEAFMGRMLRKLAAIFALASVLTGCGTLANLPNETLVGVVDFMPHEQIYGGVQRDAEVAQERLKNVVSPKGDNGRVESLVAAGYLAMIDLPLSVIGDTLTLPITIPATMKEKETTTIDHGCSLPIDHGFKLPDMQNHTYDYVHGSVE
jgi:uncharacterized protein YceK